MIIQINFVDAHKEELKKFIIEANRCWARKKLYYKIIPFAKQFFIWGYVSGIYRLGSQKMIDRLYSDPSPAKPESQSKPDIDTTSVNAKTLLIEASQESASPDGKSSTASTQQTETGGRLSSKKNKKEQKNL